MCIQSVMAGHFLIQSRKETLLEPKFSLMIIKKFMLFCNKGASVEKKVGLNKVIHKTGICCRCEKKVNTINGNGTIKYNAYCY